MTASEPTSAGHFKSSGEPDDQKAQLRHPVTDPGGVILAKTAVPDLSPVFNLADAVEKAGYDSVWIGDSVTAKSRLEVISTLGALAVKTERVKIGTAVLLAAMRNPVVLAQAWPASTCCAAGA